METRDRKEARQRGLSRGLFCLVLGMLALLVSCADPMARHKVLTNLFDGVPSLPSLQELCKDSMEDVFNEYYEARLAEAASGSLEDEELTKEKGSIHPPYRDQNCTGCHDFKKRNLLKTTKDKLCFICHKDFIKGSFVHGPVSVGACLACHFPHSSENVYLLRENRNALCGKCHKERRLAYNMHEQVIKHNMLCVNCHDPHSGNVKYFLK